MKRFFILLALVLGVVTGTAHAAVVQPGTGFGKPNAAPPSCHDYSQDSAADLTIIVVDATDSEADGYYLFVLRGKTLIGVFQTAQLPTRD